MAAADSWRRLRDRVEGAPHASWHFISPEAGVSDPSSRRIRSTRTKKESMLRQHKVSQ